MANTQNQTPINKWVVARVVTPSHITFVSKYKTKRGLWALYPPKLYAIPPKLTILAHPSILEIVEKTEIRQAKERVKEEWLQYFHGEVSESPSGAKWIIPAYVVKIRPGIYVVRVQPEKGLVEILPPVTPPKYVRYKLLIASFNEKSTLRTASTKTYQFNIEPVYETVNSSGTGAHWTRWCVWLVPIETKIMARESWVSNRGVFHEYIVDVEAGKTLERYEELEVVKEWSWGRVVKVRDNWENRELTMLVLEYHKAWKTCASTEHMVEPADAIRLLWSEGRFERTHWQEAYEVLKTPVKIRTIRITNSCKKEVTEVTIQ